MRHCVTLVSLLLSASACSFVFSEGPDESVLPVDASIDGDTDARGGSEPQVILMDDFEGDDFAIGWSTSFETGDACELSAERPKDGERSLRCQTDDTGGTRAVLVANFQKTVAIHVEMDVYIAEEPSLFVVFLQALNTTAEESASRLGSSEFYGGESPQMGLTIVSQLPQYQNDYAPGVYDSNEWHHIEFTVLSTPLKLSSTLRVDEASGSGNVSLQGGYGRIDAVEVGISLTYQPPDETTIFIDNVVITDEGIAP